MKDKLIKLAERVEAASGTDREIDILIGAATDLQIEHCMMPFRELFEMSGMEQTLLMAESHQTILRDGLPRYTKSLDAAMTLVPDGCGVARFGERTESDDRGEYIGGWSARLHFAARPVRFSLEYGKGATSALALTAACLRAIAATRTETGA